MGDLRERLLAANGVLVLTGAGVSVASGIPVYRGAAGSLYDDPETLRHAFASTLHADVEGFWERFAPRREALRLARPNAAHTALARLEARVPRFLLATQNVDDLHRRAGTRHLVELHGNAFVERCLDRACLEPPWRAAGPVPPRCPRCGKVARPDVVLFGEGDASRWEPLGSFFSEGVDVILLVGTSGVVTVPDQVLALARTNPWVVEINPTPTAVAASERFAVPAEEFLPTLLG